MPEHDWSEQEHNIATNVKYVLLNHPQFLNRKHTAIADMFKWHRTTIGRLSNASHIPERNTVMAIAKRCNLEFGIFEKRPLDFIAAYKQSLLTSWHYDPTLSRMTLPTIEKSRDKWPNCFERHRGSYFFYNKLSPAKNKKVDSYARSLLNIDTLTDRGITFTIYNKDDRGIGEHLYTYHGLLFPVGDTFLFLVGDEASGEEPLALVIWASQKAPPAFLTGYIVAIAIPPSGERYPMAGKMVLAFEDRELLAIDDVIGRLGILPKKRIPKKVCDCF